MRLSYLKTKNMARLDYDPKNARQEAIITKLNLVAWDIAERTENKVLFSVKDKEDFDDLSRWFNYLKTHDFYI